MQRSTGVPRRIGRAVSRLAAAGGALIAFSTLLALFARQWWFAELFIHFRLQYLVAGVVLMVVGALSRRPIVAVAMLASVAVNGSAVWGEFAGVAASEASTATGASTEAGRAVRLISVNVKGGSTDPAPLVGLIEAEDPDMLLVLEYSPPYEKQLAALGDRYPYRATAPSWQPYGIALYSRLPLDSLELFKLGPVDAIRARIPRPDGEIEFVGAHLMSPVSATQAAQRDEQLDTLARLAEAGGDRFLACGDLNITRYSPHFRSLVDRTGLVDTGAGRGVLWTWPVGVPALGIQIDHCLAGHSVRVANISVLGDVGSDHYPLLIEFSAGRNG